MNASFFVSFQKLVTSSENETISLPLESVSSGDVDTNATNPVSSDATISLTSTKSRQVKASLRLKEADSDFLFTLNSSKRLSKAPKTIGAILNSAALPLTLENQSEPTLVQKEGPCIRSKHDEELLERGEAIDISLPPTTETDERVFMKENVESKPKIDNPVVASKVDHRSALTRTYKRAKAIQSIADTTTNDVSESACSQTEKFDGSLSENVISSTSNDILPSSTSEMFVKDESQDSRLGRDEDFVSSSNIPDVETSTIESSEQETVTDDSNIDDSMVSVDTNRVKSQIDSELIKFGISEKDFIRVVLRNEGFDSFRAMMGPVVEWELCSNFVRKTFLTIWMWLQTSNTKKMKQFKSSNLSSDLSGEKKQSPRNDQTVLKDSNNVKVEPTLSEPVPIEYHEKQPKKQINELVVNVKKEGYSSIVSKRLTRARIFGSPAKAAEERKSMYIEELYRELPSKKPSDVPKGGLNRIVCKSETSKIAERFAKSIKKKSLAKPVAKVTKKKNRTAPITFSVDLTTEQIEEDLMEIAEKQFEKVGAKTNEVSSVASITNNGEHLDKYLSTSPSVDDTEDSAFSSLRPSDIGKSTTDISKSGSRTKNVSRKDSLILEPESIRVPLKLRLTALSDVRGVNTDVDLPLDENEEFEPGKKWVPAPVVVLSPPKILYEMPVQELGKKRKKRILTPSGEISDALVTPENVASEVAQSKPDRSPPPKRKSGSGAGISKSGSNTAKGVTNVEVDLRLADDEMSAWVSRLTIGGLGQMIDALQLTRLEMKNAFSDTASASLQEPCGLCDCCAMDLICNECAACVNGEMHSYLASNVQCPFNMCLFHIMLKYIRKLVISEFIMFRTFSYNLNIYVYEKK